MTDSVSDAPGGAILRIRVVARASRARVEGVRGDALVVRLTAPPVEGAANEALLEILSRTVGVARSRLEIVAGARSRDKRVRIAGMTAAAVTARLHTIGASSAKA